MKFLSSNAHRILLIVLIIVNLLALSGCGAMQGNFFKPVAAMYTPMDIQDGEILALQMGSTLRGIASALRADPGTAIFLSPDNKTVLFSWPLKDIGQGWVFLENTLGGWATNLTKAQGTGNVVNSDTWTGFAKYLSLVKVNWRLVSQDMVEYGLLQEISGALAVGKWASVATATWATEIAIGTMPTILLMPVIDLKTLEDMIKAPVVYQ